MHGIPLNYGALLPGVDSGLWPVLPFETYSKYHGVGDQLSFVASLMLFCLLLASGLDVASD